MQQKVTMRRYALQPWTANLFTAFHIYLHSISKAMESRKSNDGGESHGQPNPRCKIEIKIEREKSNEEARVA